MYIGPERHRPGHKTGGLAEAESFPKVWTGEVYDSIMTLIAWEFPQNIHRLRIYIKLDLIKGLTLYVDV